MSDYTDPIDMTADVLDTRDIIARIDWLDREAETEDERDELAALVTFRDEHAADIPDWDYGETLIRDSYFEDYARELAEDIGAIDRDASWPLQFIDWPAAARALQIDYTDVTLDGTTYWAR